MTLEAIKISSFLSAFTLSSEKTTFDNIVDNIVRLENEENHAQHKFVADQVKEIFAYAEQELNFDKSYINEIKEMYRENIDSFYNEFDKLWLTREDDFVFAGGRTKLQAIA